MMLLVDIGNTRVKWGLSRDREISATGALAHGGRAPTEIWSAAWRELPRPERIVATNVAGAVMAENLRAFCRERFQLAAEFVTPCAQAAGVTNGYYDPTQLGADRWAAVIGAFTQHGGPICVVGCGTAITVDTVNREGRHLGGLIAPGVEVMQRALATASSALPAELGDSVQLFARDTRTAVTSGVLYAAAGFVERAVRGIRAQQAQDVEVLLTGGDAERLHPLMPGRFTLAPHLVLEGLAVLAEPRT